MDERSCEEVTVGVWRDEQFDRGDDGAGRRATVANCRLSVNVCGILRYSALGLTDLTEQIVELTQCAQSQTWCLTALGSDGFGVGLPIRVLDQKFIELWSTKPQAPSFISVDRSSRRLGKVEDTSRR